MRDKEKVHDYRFLPEPNLPPLVLYTDKTLPDSCLGNVVNIDQVKRCMPELPEETRQRLQKNYKISLEQSVILVVSLVSPILQGKEQCGTKRR